MNDHTRTELGTSLLRIALGTMFVSHGLLKLLVFTMPGTVAFFHSLGLPGALAYVVVTAELVGGTLLLLGLGTRTVALVLLPILIGATWAHSGNGWFFASPKGGWEYPLFLAVSLFVVVLQGAGCYSLDALRGRTTRLQTAGAQA